MTDIEVTFNPQKLPKLKEFIKSFKQLAVLDEKDNQITVQGYRSLIDVVWRSIYCYAVGQKATVEEENADYAIRTIQVVK